MATAYRLCVGIVTALAVCKYSLAEWNATEEPAVQNCHRHGDGDNCTVSPTDATDTTDTDQWSGHFSSCPEELLHYCIHGECRYVEEQKTQSCRCHHGYVGSRCEYVDLGPRIADPRQIIIVCIIAGLVMIILLIVFVCICSHRRCRLCRRRGRRREEPRNGTEKLRMMDTGAAHAASTPDAAEAPHTNSV
ncbi:probetacellulin [Mugil cephalus]|uniref:probetacellulin n=1 Tax=Mugil cephalus TaxID=48193 RepID=UPI001FB63363|nr:probetacellulin [Mugil cephalus]